MLPIQHRRFFNSSCEMVLPLHSHYCTYLSRPNWQSKIRKPQEMNGTPSKGMGAWTLPLSFFQNTRFCADETLLLVMSSMLQFIHVYSCKHKVKEWLDQTKSMTMTCHWQPGALQVFQPYLLYDYMQHDNIIVNSVCFLGNISQMFFEI